MYDQQLRTAYDAIKGLPMNFQVEPFEIVKQVHQYRMYWKPETVKTLLLAESHVFTSAELFAQRHIFDGLAGYPEEYVRFVYCLSYGDSDSILNPLPGKSSGTPQFWKLFNETVKRDLRVTNCPDKNKTVAANFCVVNNPDKADKRAEKIALLQEMQKKGVWLMDCGITGVYVPGGQAPSSNDYNQILKTSFDKYCLPIIEETNPQQIIVVGQRVYNLLKADYKLSMNLDWIHQPQARVTNEQRRTLAKIGYKPV